MHANDKLLSLSHRPTSNIPRLGTVGLNILAKYLGKMISNVFSVDAALDKAMLWSRIRSRRSWCLLFKLQSCNLARSHNCLLYLTFFHSYAQYYVGWLKWSCCLFPKRHRLTTIKKRRSIRRSWWPHSKLQSCMFTLLYLTFCDEEQYIFLNCSNL